jgi:hypothetical protein
LIKFKRDLPTLKAPYISGGAAQADGRDRAWYPADASSLAAFEFFYAVRDGDAARVQEMLRDQLVDPSTPLLPSHFPVAGARPPPCHADDGRGDEAGDGEGGKGGRAGKGGGRERAERAEGWPREGFEGVYGDTGLHLAARHVDAAMVEVLLAGGASPLIKNRNKEKAIECVGVCGRGWQAQDDEGGEGAGRGSAGDGEESEEEMTEEEKDAAENERERVWCLLDDAEVLLAGEQVQELHVSGRIELLPISAEGYTLIDAGDAGEQHPADFDARPWAGGSWRCAK